MSNLNLVLLVMEETDISQAALVSSIDLAFNQ